MQHAGFLLMSRIQARQIDKTGESRYSFHRNETTEEDLCVSPCATTKSLKIVAPLSPESSRKNYPNLPDNVFRLEILGFPALLKKGIKAIVFLCATNLLLEDMFEYLLKEVQKEGLLRNYAGYPKDTRKDAETNMDFLKSIVRLRSLKEDYSTDEHNIKPHTSIRSVRFFYA